MRDWIVPIIGAVLIVATLTCGLAMVLPTAGDIEPAVKTLIGE